MLNNLKLVRRSALQKASRFNNIRLEKNERISEFEKKFIQLFKSKLRSEHFTCYPELYNFYESLSKYHNLKANSFFATAGIDAGIKNCIEIFGNKKIIILKPSFAMINLYCKIYRKKTISIGYNQNLELNKKKIYKSLDKKTSLVIISNPNSPTGTYIKIKEIEQILKKAKKFKIKVLLDEAYFGFSKKSAISLIKKYNNLIILRTFSKAYGLAGLRVGYAISNTTNIKQLNNTKPMYEINSLGILAATILLQDKKIKTNYINETKLGKNYLLNFFNEKKIEYLDSDTNFILFKIKKNKKKYFFEFKRKKIHIIENINIKNYNNFSRITIGPKNILKKFVNILSKY